MSGPLLYLRPSEYRRQLEVNMISPLVVCRTVPLCDAQSFRKTMNRILPKFSENAYTSQPFVFSEIYSGY